MVNSAGVRWLFVVVLAACGSPGKGGERAGSAEVAQAPTSDAGAADAGAFMGQPLYTSVGDGGTGTYVPGIDASLAELGFQPCRDVFDRMMNCPQVPQDQKAQIAQAAEQMEQMAADPNQREMVGSACVQMAKAAEQQLGQMGC